MPLGELLADLPLHHVGVPAELLLVPLHAVLVITELLLHLRLPLQSLQGGVRMAVTIVNTAFGPASSTGL